MKSKKKVVILTEGQVNSLMENLRVERDKRILSEINSLSKTHLKLFYNPFKYTLKFFTCIN